MLASVVIRTYNEEKHLAELLAAIQKQDAEYEIVLVDSGSTDRTLEIANLFNANISHIKKEDFTFGRSLNVGCAAAAGEALVFISGHCIPATQDWLRKLVEPLRSGAAVYSYGKQIGRDTTKFSETQVFRKYFPDHNMVPQAGFFCNNANAALLKSAWKNSPFDEELTGLEDMYLAKELVGKGEHIAYVADAIVYHIHDETWMQIKNRYEREAIALRKIMPQVHVKLMDFFRYYFSSVYHDCVAAKRQRSLDKYFVEILIFRLMHFWGTYKGNHMHRKLSARDRERFFFPK